VITGRFSQSEMPKDCPERGLSLKVAPAKTPL
jgi:hypothetical protein